MAFTQGELAPENMNVFNRGVIARLKPGVSHQAAQTNLDAIAQRIGTGMRTTIPGGVAIDLRTKVVPVREVFSRDVRHGLVMLMGAVGLLLVIACVNLAESAAGAAERPLPGTGHACGGRRIPGPAGQAIAHRERGAGDARGCGGRSRWRSGVPRCSWRWARPVSSMAASLPLAPPVFLFAMSMVLGVGLAVGLIPALSMGRGGLHGTLTEGGRGMSTGGGRVACGGRSSPLKWRCARSCWCSRGSCSAAS